VVAAINVQARCVPFSGRFECFKVRADPAQPAIHGLDVISRRLCGQLVSRAVHFGYLLLALVLISAASACAFFSRPGQADFLVITLKCSATRSCSVGLCFMLLDRCNLVVNPFVAP